MVSMKKEFGSLLYQLGAFGKSANDPKKLCQNSAKLPKMTDKKPLLEHQKQSIELAIDEISSPIFSTTVI